MARQPSRRRDAQTGSRTPGSRSSRPPPSQTSDADSAVDHLHDVIDILISSCRCAWSASLLTVSYCATNTQCKCGTATRYKEPSVDQYCHLANKPMIPHGILEPITLDDTKVWHQAAHLQQVLVEQRLNQVHGVCIDRRIPCRLGPPTVESQSRIAAVLQRHPNVRSESFEACFMVGLRFFYGQT